MSEKLKNWEELCNDGDNYGGEGQNLSPKEKILFENIKDKNWLQAQVYNFLDFSRQISKILEIVKAIYF